MKASDITDARIYEAVRSSIARCVKEFGHEPVGAFMRDMVGSFPEFPEKVVRAKLAQMINKGRLNGCTCGCRGDFRIPHDRP